MSKLSSKFYSAPLDQAGKEIKFDVREDEDQDLKLQETVSLLVAAGYFRARIKGLSAFDKIVGGMTWCIDTCNFDVDVDLLFNESSTIGQKITLTERIVSVLPRMKCPYAIEPHQIQGLDFINIFPVIQWLVKKAIETRAEMGDLNRNFALLQFSKLKCQGLAETEISKNKHASKTIKYLSAQNQPQRKYLRKNANKDTHKLVQVQSTLLEYGQQNILLSNLLSQGESSDKDSAKKSYAKSETVNVDEEKNLKKLINQMSETDKKQNKVSASAVGHLLGFQQSEIQQIADEFATKESELQQEMENLDESAGGLHHKQRLLNILKKQIDHKQVLLDEKQAEINKIEGGLKSKNHHLDEFKEEENGLQENLTNLEEYEKNVDKKSVEKLQKLVTINDELKQKEQDFKKGCKKELSEIENELESLKNGLEATNLKGEDNDRQGKIKEQYETSKAKMHTLRLKNAKKNREISTLKRKLDEIPSRIELSQYQKRFVELYNQISNVHRETKQFYIFYNVLEDKKLYMNKEINLLNSISEQFARAMSTQSNREQFVKQLEVIINGIKGNLTKVENKKGDLKARCDELNDQYNHLIVKKRSYYIAVKDFQEECKKNEALIARSQ